MVDSCMKTNIFKQVNEVANLKKKISAFSFSGSAVARKHELEIFSYAAPNREECQKTYHVAKPKLLGYKLLSWFVIGFKIRTILPLLDQSLFWITSKGHGCTFPDYSH